MSGLKSFVLIQFIILSTVLIGFCNADQFEDWKPLGTERVPTLVFINESSGFNTSLYMALIRNEQVEVRKILTSRFIKTKKIGESVLLVNTSGSFEGSSQWSQAYYLVDLKKGTVTLLSKSKLRNKLIHITCLRTVPDENRAMLLRYGRGAESNQLLEVNLATLDIKKYKSFPKDGDFSHFSGPNMRLSPDFRYLVTMIPDDIHRDRREGTGYTLRSLDLKSMTFSDLDKNVSVMILSVSSLVGTPPYDWISDTQILYRHMPVPEAYDLYAREGKYVLKCVDIRTHDISEWITKQMSLTSDGGNLKKDPFTGIIYYNYSYIVDPNTKTLKPVHFPHEIMDQVSDKIAQMIFIDKVREYFGPTGISLSDSEKYLAYFDRPDNEELGTLYVYIKGDDAPVKVGCFNKAEPVAWLEM